MVGKTSGKGSRRTRFRYVERFADQGRDIRDARSLRKDWQDLFDKSPPAALGLLTYYEGWPRGCASFMAGSRKFSLEHMSRATWPP